MLAAAFICAAASVRAEARCFEVPADTSGKVLTDTLSEVVVTGTRNETDIRHLPMTVSVVDRPLIEYSNVPSLLPVLTEQVPGLFITSRGIMGYGVSEGAAGTISMRGLSGGSGQVMVLIDGHPQYMGMFGHPISDAYQSLMAERVEVLRGPASVLYGSNAMGGVVNIVTRRMEQDGVRTDINAGYGSWNTVQTELTNRVRYKGFSSIVSASYNRTDGHRADMGFEQYGEYAKLGYEISGHWRVRADVNVTHFNASNPGTVSNPLSDADQSVTRGMTSLAVENEYEGTSGALSVFYNWGDHQINDGYYPLDTTDNQPLDYRFNSHDDMMGISAYQSVRMFRGNRLTVGVDWYRFGGSAWNQYVAGERRGEREDIVDIAQHEVAGYVDFRQNIGTWLTLDAGVRIDHHSHIGVEWVPQAGLSFHLPNSMELKASVSKGFRYPTIREMYMFPPVPETAGGQAFIRSQCILYRRGQFHHDADGGRPSAQCQCRGSAQCGSGGSGGLAYRPRLVCGRQLQFPSHGESRSGSSGAQALRRRSLYSRPLACVHRRAVCGGTLHSGRRQSGAGGFRTVEYKGFIPHPGLDVRVGARRESAQLEV